MLLIDEARIHEEIEKRKPRSVVLSAPDGLGLRVHDLALKLASKYNIEVFVSGDPCYGSCDTVSDYDVKRLGADLAFHIGHKVSIERLGNSTVMVDAYDDISFDPVLAKAVSTLAKYSTIGLATISQHLHRLEEARRFLESSGLTILVGRGRGQLMDGQVFGCEFYPVFDIKDQVAAFAFLGQSAFHVLGVALSTNRPTFMLDPYYNEVVDAEQLVAERRKRAILSIYRARDAQNFGIIVGLKEGQMLVRRSLELKRKLEAHGRTVSMLTMREITEDRLLQFPQIEAFVQTACPRISVDGDTFTKPVLSVPQAEALLAIWEGKQPGDFFERSHWL